MIKHIVLFSLDEGISSDQVDILLKLLEQLPVNIREIVNFSFGVTEDDENIFDFALIADFISGDDLEIYINNSFHKEVVEHIRVVCKKVKVIDMFI